MKRLLSLFLITAILCSLCTAFAADKVLVEKITLSQDSACIPYRKTIMLKATIEPRTASDKTLVWESSDETVATVKDGRIVGVGTGTATITATARDGSGVSASALISVVTPVTKIQPDYHTLVLAPEMTWPLFWTIEPETADNQELTWTSSNTKVATVTENGVIYARSTGTTTLTAAATDGSGTKATVNVQVKPHDYVITKAGDFDVDFETEDKKVSITIINAGKSTSKNTQRVFKSKNGCVITPADMVLRPVKAGSDTVSMQFIEKKALVKAENHSVFVAPSAIGETARLTEEGEPAEIRFLNLPWDNNYPQVKTYLDNNGSGLKPLSQRNEYLRAILIEPVPFGNLTAYSAAVNFSYTPGDRLYEVRNALFKGDFYFDKEIPIDTLIRTIRSVYGLGVPEHNGDVYSWERDGVGVVLTQKSRFTILELIWVGEAEEEEAGTPAEETAETETAGDEAEDGDGWDF